MVAQPAKSLVKYFPLFNKQKSKIALDYGSGNLRNSVFLHRMGYEVYAIDLPYKVRFRPLPKLNCLLPDDLQKMGCEADLAICTFVLNLISEQERINVIENIARKMKPGGYLLIETKGMSLLEIDALVLPRCFIRVHNHAGRYTQIALYQYRPEIDT